MQSAHIFSSTQMLRNRPNSLWQIALSARINDQTCERVARKLLQAWSSGKPQKLCRVCFVFYCVFSLSCPWSRHVQNKFFLVCPQLKFFSRETLNEFLFFHFSWPTPSLTLGLSEKFQSPSRISIRLLMKWNFMFTCSPSWIDFDSGRRARERGSEKKEFTNFQFSIFRPDTPPKSMWNPFRKLFWSIQRPDPVE